MYFKACYVEPILSGRKRVTYRLPGKRHPKVGSVIPLSVGPRPPFAWARVISSRLVTADEIEPDHLAELISIYGEQEDYWEIRFELVEVAEPLSSR